MKLKICLQNGRNRGLQTIGEAVFDVKVRASSVFSKNAIINELSEITEERDRLFSQTNFSDRTKLTEAITWME